MPDITTQITDLRKLRDTAQRHRADADAALKISAQQTKDVEADIRKEGVNPETIDQELAALEADLQLKVGELAAATQIEIEGCQKILAAAQAAGLR